MEFSAVVPRSHSAATDSHFSNHSQHFSRHRLPAVERPILGYRRDDKRLSPVSATILSSIYSKPVPSCPLWTGLYPSRASCCPFSWPLVNGSRPQQPATNSKMPTNNQVTAQFDPWPDQKHQSRRWIVPTVPDPPLQTVWFPFLCFRSLCAIAPSHAPISQYAETTAPSISHTAFAANYASISNRTWTELSPNYSISIAIRSMWRWFRECRFCPCRRLAAVDRWVLGIIRDRHLCGDWHPALGRIIHFCTVFRATGS